MRAIKTLFLTTIIGVPGFVSFAEEPGRIEFAPGAQGSIDANIGKIMNEAEKAGEVLADELIIQAPDIGTFSVSQEDLDAMRDRAFNNPLVQNLLGLSGETIAAAGAEAERYGEDEAFIFASFSIPKDSLLRLFSEARTLGVPVIFRGFVNNSVIETRRSLESVFPKEQDIPGFTIDPIMFQRFSVKTVPTFIATKKDAVSDCEQISCDVVDPENYDVLRGNIFPITAFRLISVNGEAGVPAAKQVLGEDQ